MRLKLTLLLLIFTTPAVAQKMAAPSDAFISPSRPVPVGNAPAMQAKLVKDTPGEQIYSIIFYKDDDVMSGLTDFCYCTQSFGRALHRHRCGQRRNARLAGHPEEDV
jgi:hypothetical protein